MKKQNYGKFVNNRQSRNFDHYNKISAKCAKAIRKFKQNRERRILTGGKRNALFSYVNNRLNSKSSISALKLDDGSIVVDDFARSNLFGSAFSSVFVYNDDRVHDVNIFAHNSLSWVSFSPQIVHKFLGAMQPKHSHSPDGFSQFFLRELRDVLCYPHWPTFLNSLF